MQFTDGPLPPLDPFDDANGEAVDVRGAMPGDLAIICEPAAHRLMRRWAPALDRDGSLVGGAVAIAMHGRSDVDAEHVDRRLQAMADEVRSRVTGSQVQATLAHLHAYLFDELGFCGDAEDFYNPANSDLGEVLERRRGLPILLSLVYREVATRLGLTCEGVALPGHFVVSVGTESTPMLVDPFFGGTVLSRGEALERVRGLLGEHEAWDESMLKPVTSRHWLTRILQNLLGSYSAAGRYGDVAAMLELELLLWPDQPHLHRDLGLCLARVGLPTEAARSLKQYLRTEPDDPQVPDLEELLSALA